MNQEGTALFSGTFARSMDAKKRVAVPASWLNAGEGQLFYVIPNPLEDCLIVMPPKEFESQEQLIKESDAPAPMKRKAIRQLYGGAHSTTTDKQGRILLNEKHCEAAGLSGEVIFLGGRSRFEIWSPDRHTSSEEGQKEALREVAELIAL